MPDTTEVKIIIDDIYVAAMLGFVKDLNDEVFAKAIKANYEDTQAMSNLRDLAWTLIQQKIYDVYTPRVYQRTYGLLRSVKSTTGVVKSDKAGSLAIYSDPAVAPATGYGGSYIAFFEHPIEFSSYIKPVGQESFPVNYRPFFDTLSDLCNKYFERNAVVSVTKAMVDLMPRILA